MSANNRRRTQRDFWIIFVGLVLMACLYLFWSYQAAAAGNVGLSVVVFLAAFVTGSWAYDTYRKHLRRVSD